MGKEYEIDFLEYDCDGNELRWRCPECGASHITGDLAECLGNTGDLVASISCDSCDQDYDIHIAGEYLWQPYGDMAMKAWHDMADGKVVKEPADE